MGNDLYQQIGILYMNVMQGNTTIAKLQEQVKKRDDEIASLKQAVADLQELHDGNAPTRESTK